MSHFWCTCYEYQAALAMNCGRIRAELTQQLPRITDSLATVTKMVGAAFLQTLGHALDELLQEAILLAGLWLLIQLENVCYACLEKLLCHKAARLGVWPSGGVRLGARRSKVTPPNTIFGERSIDFGGVGVSPVLNLET